MGIGGNFYRIIKSMYASTPTALKINGGITDTFPTNKDVRQGDNLSPTMFNLFMNDLHFDEALCVPATLHTEHVSHLLWADDLFLISEAAEGLQYCLNEVDVFCNTWHLQVNTDKSNIMVIKRGRKVQHPKVMLGKL
jgi:hypothetical protein